MGKTAGWALFLGCLLILSFAASSPYSRSADLALISLRLVIVIGLSVLVVRERWLHREHRQRATHLRSGVGETILERFRRWYYDEQKHPN